MNVVALFEATGVVACVVGIASTLKARHALTPDSRVALLALLVTSAVLHLFDLAEWTGSEQADRYGDIIKVLTPAVWLFFLFVVTRDGLLGKVEDQGQQLDFFFEQTPQAVAVLDERQRYLACSRTWLDVHGLSEVPLGTPLDESPPRWGGSWARISRDCLKSGATLDGLEHFEGEGNEDWFEWRVRPLRRGGRTAGTILVVEPVTKRIREERAREEAQERLLRHQNLETVGEIASGVAHDVNNLLQVIGAHAELLGHEQDQDEEVRDSLDSIRQAVGAASGMTRWLLSFSRRQSAALVVADLYEIVQRVAKLLERTLPRGQSLRLELRGEPLLVRTDPTLLEQLLINLVLNARDAMPRGGRISVTVFERERERWLEVKDEGTGIEDHLRQKILEPFFTTKGDHGTGLGLAVVQRAIARHRASLVITSNVGEGAIFAVAFPHPDDFNDRPAPDSAGAREADTLKTPGETPRARRRAARSLLRGGD